MRSSLQQSKDGSALDVTTLGSIAPEQIDWLWPGRLALGKMTMIAGDPGLGKSQVALAVAATVTRGGLWPCGEGQAQAGDVIVLSAEDGIADTIRPRFDAAGGDPWRLHVVRAVTRPGQMREFNLTDDLALLEGEIARRDARLVIIDPVTAYLKGDGHRNEAVRRMLQPIGAMAERWRVAVLLVTHLSKMSRKAIYRIIGSVAFAATARAGFTVIADPEDTQRRLLLQVKNNVASGVPGLAFRLAEREIASGIAGSHVVWEDATVAEDAEEMLAEKPDRARRLALEEAVSFLKTFLADGPKSVRDIEREATRAGMLPRGRPISQVRLMRDARKQLGIQPVKSLGGEWVWGLPGMGARKPEGGG